VIQRAAMRALAAGTTLPRLLRDGGGAAGRGERPARAAHVLPARVGLAAFARAAVRRVDGVIVVIYPEEADPLARGRGRGLDLIHLVARPRAEACDSSRAGAMGSSTSLR